jgi:hypothetical protein
MKQFLVIIFLLTAHSVMAETYYVTFVKGTAKVIGAAKNISVGDKLNDKDQLVFIDKSAKISCISPAKGRFDITSDKSKQNSKKEWVAVLTDLLVPSYSGKQLSTRAIGDDNSPETLFKSSHPENKLLLVEDQWIEISTTAPLDKSNFFFLQYDVNGKTMVKKLPSKEHAISFNRSLLVGVNGEVLTPEQVSTVALCSQSLQNGKPVSKVVARFVPVFLSHTAFNDEAALLKTHLASLITNVEKLNNEVYNHFYSNYGAVNPSLFRKWLK